MPSAWKVAIRGKVTASRNLCSKTADCIERMGNGSRDDWVRKEPGKSYFLDEASLIYIHDGNLLYWLQTQ